MRKGQSADQIRAYAAIREGRSPQRTSRPVAPYPSPGKSTETRTDYEAILRGRERLEEIDDVKLRRFRALAIKEELEIQRLRSQLVPTVYVREWATRFLSDSRDVMLKAPPELCDAVAAESEPVRVSEILRAWVERTLAEIFQRDELWAAASKAK